MARVGYRYWCGAAATTAAVIWALTGSFHTSQAGDAATTRPVTTRATLVAAEEVFGKLVTGYLGQSIIVSPDGKHTAYLAKQVDKWVVVLDGKPGTGYDGIGNNSQTFSPDGQRLAYYARRADKWFLVIDGVEHREVENFSAQVPLFSPDSQRVACLVLKSKKWHIEVYEKGKTVPAEQPEYDDTGTNSTVFSPDSRRLAYLARRGTKWLLVVDGKEGAEYDGGTSPVFSPDSRSVACWLTLGNRWVFVVNGKETKDYQGYLRGSKISFEGPDTIWLLVLQNDVIIRAKVDVPK